MAIALRFKACHFLCRWSVRRVCLSALIMVVGLAAASGVAAAQSTPTSAPTRVEQPTVATGPTEPVKKTVLVLLPFQSDLPVSKLAMQTLQEEFATANDLALTVYYEFLDSSRFSDSAYQQQLFDLFATKYRDKPIDLVMIETETTLDAWLQQREQIAPNAPVVYFDTLREAIAADSLPPEVTGVGGVLDYTQSIAWMLRARPDVNEVAVVHGVGAIDLAPDNIRPVTAFVQEMGQQVRITDLSNLPLSEIKRRVAALPPSAVVLYHPMFEDAAGDKYGPMAVLRELAAVAAVPVLSGFDQLIGAGTIGGYMYSLEHQTRHAVQIGLRILHGEAASSIPRLNDQSGPFIFDHLALQRYGIPLSALPPDAIVQNRQYSFWELYRPQIIVVGIAFAVLLLLVLFLTVLNRRLNKTRLALRDLNVSLEDQVQERTAALSQAKEDAEQAAIELGVSEARFRSTFELPLAGFAITSPDKGWLEVNAGLCAVLGYSAQELAGKTWAELTYPEDLAADEEQFARVLAGEIDTYALEKRFIHKDGAVVWTNLSVGCVRNPDRSVAYTVVLLHNITARKLAEEALRQSEERFRTIFTSAPIGIALMGLGERPLLANAAVERFFGRSAAQLQQTSSQELTHPDDWEEDTRLLAEMRAGERSGYSIDKRYLRPDGRIVWGRLTVSAIHNAAGVLTGAISMVEDITERKQIAEALTQARDAAEAANRAKSQFLANMSHELRTPLNAILGFSELMARDPNLPPAQVENLAIINRSGEHLLGLINDVLDLAKIEAGRTMLHEQTFDLHQLLTDLGDMFRLRAAATGLDWRVKWAADVPGYVCADESKLRQVLINLLGNAVKFTATGGVDLTVEVVAPATAGGVCTLRFAVQDTGPGIAPEELGAIFEPFVQSASGRTAPEGTGLGLPISRQFARLMGGDLVATSPGEPGLGSRFVLEVPVRVVAGDGGAEATPAHRRALHLAPDEPVRRLLVVEDNAAGRKLLADLLIGLGFSVRTAEHGQQGLDIWAEWQPHLIWMDMRMPVMDGREATRCIRTLPQGREPVIVALSAGVLSEDRAAVLADGCDEFLGKPFCVGEIVDCLVRHLGVRMVYADDASAGDLAPAPFDLADLPDGWATRVRDAASAADATQLLALAAQVEASKPVMAQTLRAWVAEFDYDAMLAAVSAPADQSHADD